MSTKSNWATVPIYRTLSTSRIVNRGMQNARLENARQTNERSDGCTNVGRTDEECIQPVFDSLRFFCHWNTSKVTSLSFSKFILSFLSLMGLISSSRHTRNRNLCVKLHLRDGWTDGRKDATRLFVRPSVRVLDGGWHFLYIYSSHWQSAPFYKYMWSVFDWRTCRESMHKPNRPIQPSILRSVNDPCNRQHRWTAVALFSCAIAYRLVGYTYLLCRKFCSESIGERILKIDQLFAKLMTWVGCLLTHSALRGLHPFASRHLCLGLSRRINSG